MNQREWAAGLGRWVGVVGAAVLLAAGHPARVEAGEGAAVRVTNTSGAVVAIPGASGAPMRIPPGGSREVVVEGGVLALQVETPSDPVRSAMTVRVAAESGDALKGTLMVSNQHSERVEVSLDGQWASTLAVGSSFVQPVEPGAHTISLRGPASKAALAERQIEVRGGQTFTWLLGAAPASGEVGVVHLGTVPVMVSLNGGDAGELAPGASRLLVVPAASENGASAPVVVGAGGVWSAPVAPAEPAAGASAGVEPAAGASAGVEPAAGASAGAAPEPSKKEPVGTLRLSNQTGMRMEFFVNGESVGWLEPGKELDLEGRPLGDYVLEAEDPRAGAFVRAEVSLQRAGRIVVWAATGWF